MLGRIYSDLKRYFSYKKQNYRYYISVLDENIEVIDIKCSKWKNEIFTVFENYKILGKKQSSYQLKVFYKNRGKENMERFDDYLKEKV